MAQSARAPSGLRPDAPLFIPGSTSAGNGNAIGSNRGGPPRTTSRSSTMSTREGGDGGNHRNVGGSAGKKARIPRGRSMYMRRNRDNPHHGSGGGGLRRGSSFVHRGGNGSKGSWRRGNEKTRPPPLDERHNGGAGDRPHLGRERSRTGGSFYNKSKGSRSFYGGGGRGCKGEKDKFGDDISVTSDNTEVQQHGANEGATDAKKLIATVSDTSNESSRTHGKETAEDLSDAHAAFLRMSGLDPIPSVASGRSFSPLESADISNVTSPSSTDHNNERNVERGQELPNLSDSAPSVLSIRHRSEEPHTPNAKIQQQGSNLPLSATSSVSVDQSETLEEPSPLLKEGESPESELTNLKVENPHSSTSLKDSETEGQDITDTIVQKPAVVEEHDALSEELRPSHKGELVEEESTTSERDPVPEVNGVEPPLVGTKGVQPVTTPSTEGVAHVAVVSHGETKVKEDSVEIQEQVTTPSAGVDVRRSVVRDKRDGRHPQISARALDVPRDTSETKNIASFVAPSTPNASLSSGRWCQSCAGLGLQIAALVAENEKIRLAEAENNSNPSPAPSKKGWKFPDAFRTKVLGGDSKGSSEKARLRQEIEVLRATVDFLYRKLDAM